MMEAEEMDINLDSDEILVIVTKYLNVRLNAPSVNATCHQYLAPGTKLRVKKDPIEGDTYDSDNRWLKGSADTYYWIGGTNHPDYLNTEQPEVSSGENSNESQADWLEQLTENLGGLPPDQGNGVIVAVLDSGTNGTDLGGLLLGGASYLDAVRPVDFYMVPADDSTDLHGTSMASIIHTLSPSCSIMSLKVTEENTTRDSAFKAALQDIIDAYAQPSHPMRSIGLPTILSMSISSSMDDDLIAQFDELYSALAQLGVSVIVAAGNEYDLSDKLFSSAGSAHTLRVATFSDDQLTSILEADTPRPEVCFKNRQIEIGIEDRNLKYYGCSPYTAICAGLVARSGQVDWLLDRRSSLMTSDNPTQNLTPYRLSS